MNVVIYDGDCGFCQYWIRWLLKHDSNERLLFADQYSAFFQSLPVRTADSVMLIAGRHSYTKSDAVIEILAAIGCRKLAFAGRLVPKVLRDALYEIIAKYRHRLAPKSCEIMPDAYKKRFIG
ncbi:DUF393 domain-containing protein [Macrococcus equipercicus]|uniref:DUF393 domain-containing protein n=1 Tax=Macrococcus equipercicus TaxID=69967 RepID=A0ABQ6R6W6_9STAP|nr:DCC1-like thiol-disulfide oxidoreductase family protein [Macrococcus equipercicus]KAA1037615.1 DUF393 domain-containing protein [Macrococcus equipercicus]